MRTSPATRWTCRFLSVLSSFRSSSRLQILTAVLLMTSTVFVVEAAPSKDPLANGPPEIVDFTWENDLGTVYVFSGKVNDERPGGLTVTFGGGLEGFSATTADDGTFWIAKVLKAENMGVVSATTVDDLGLDSNVARTFAY